ncbi:hypothetical protein DPX16_3158 [Anabarilius grahami]|uniref:Uncharacterized protein n=1 Tax=Anabarilius grahami TaxID=495550 RepID=A0A3N0YYW4_ANAGA|nr:hypothetical protein DPX16_3158 [Anabarilius grahami]
MCEEGLDVLTEPVSVHHSGSPSSSAMIVILMLLKQGYEEESSSSCSLWGPAHRLQTPDLSNMGRIRVEDSRTAYCTLETVTPHYGVLIISENNMECFSSM